MMKTKHIETRMKQRGIAQDEIDMVHRFGIRIRDRIYLTSKNCSLVDTELDRLIREFSEGAWRTEGLRIADDFDRQD